MSAHEWAINNKSVTGIMGPFLSQEVGVGCSSSKVLGAGLQAALMYVAGKVTTLKERKKNEVTDIAAFIFE